MNDLEQIKNWQRLDARTTTSGKLLKADITALANLGVRHVINLAPDEHEEALQNEASLLEQCGIAYTHIPVPFDAPDDEHYNAFVVSFEQDDNPIHVHCMANMRVSAFFYRYHRDSAGMTADKARALMEQQWAPDKSDHPTMQIWAKFISAR